MKSRFLAFGHFLDLTIFLVSFVIQGLCGFAGFFFVCWWDLL